MNLSKSYGRLKLLHKVASHKITDAPQWVCRCYCGNLCTKSQYSLTRTTKPVRSCGDCNDHIKYKTEYNIYTSMKQRCYDPNCPAYPDYGGRGLEVCQRWRQDFLFFLEDMGFRPYDFTLDRKDNDAHYCPENCRWITTAEQARNRSDTRRFQYRGKIMLADDISKLCGIFTTRRTQTGG